MGYDIYLFLSRTSADKFICAVCQGVAKDVFETDCGHIFCRTCVGKLIRVTTTNNTSAQCPHCRANVTWQNVHGSKFLNREIFQLQCKCNLCSTWTGDLSKLSDHQLTECPDQFIDCIWKKYGCKETKIKRKDMHKHNDKSKVTHLELKINCLQSQHQTQIQTLKRKYEQQINQLNEEKILLEKKWKQKLILIHKKYGVITPVNSHNNKARNDISISHIEHINITTVNTPQGEVQYHSDGSISYDPNGSNNNTNNVSPLNNNQNNNPIASRTRRKRTRSVLDEFGNESNENGNVIGGSRKRIKKRRKVENNGSKSILNALVRNNNNSNNSNNSNMGNGMLRRSSRSVSQRKKKETPKGRMKRRVSNDSVESSESESGSGSGSDSDSDANMS